MLLSDSPAVLPASYSLLTDFYQFTMAYGYWKAGMARTEAVFHLFFRTAPFGGAYGVCCGLDRVIDFVARLRFSNVDIDYLGSLLGDDGKAMFESAFLDYLQQLRFTVDLAAIPEGTVVFPCEPMLRIQGPIIQCQLLETPLLNLINYPTLIATKASHMKRAAQGDPVLEFGARRAQGPDGALTASRAAYIGGCDATSNVLAGRTFGIPLKGTIAHSWVMAFEDELEAFETYARILPNNCVLLVDTYQTLEGVRKAIRVGLELRRLGYRLAGIRLDSGDLAYLSSEARVLLDAAGLSDTQIVVSNDLDETLINDLKTQQAPIDIWGVGTKLITAFDHPALGGVYKLAAIRHPGRDWRYVVKVSEQLFKVSNPGIQQVRRFQRHQRFCADMIYDTRMAPFGGDSVIVDPFDSRRCQTIRHGTEYDDLLLPVIQQGLRVYDSPSINDIRARTAAQMSGFSDSILRTNNPEHYPVGNEQSLNAVRLDLIAQARLKSLDGGLQQQEV
jgi:nicotinate phosphoribosyltransferase